jgi:SAM-dependent methyltransferase
MVDASRRLYDAVLTPFPAADRVLEVGCGRGAGAAFALESRPIRRYVGVDLSGEHVRMSRTRLASRSAQFVVADGSRLPVAPGGFDAVFSVEAAMHFENRQQFYRDVARSLRPEGLFFLASMWKRSEVDPVETFEACGFTVAERADITANVVRSLARSSSLRRQIVESLELPERFGPLLMSWAGVRGYSAYESLAAGAVLYLRYRLVRR